VQLNVLIWSVVGKCSCFSYALIFDRGTIVKQIEMIKIIGVQFANG